MKTIIGTFILLISLSTVSMAKKGFDLEKEVIINVSSEQLWKMIGDSFIEVYKWSSNVDYAIGRGESEFTGATYNQRVCDVNVKGFSKIDERLIKYDEEGMSLAYVVKEGMPGFITKAANDWKVVSLGEGQSKLVMKAEFRSKGLMGVLMNGMLKKNLTKTLDTVLNDAKVYAETGEVSIAKRKRLDFLTKKEKRSA